MPAMTFTVFPKELCVDINEDGFALLDVLSICDTGQSSKRLDEESTGEKGFGFKAVFGVADQVHVQSGLWSFRFEHQRHQDGMGMIYETYWSMDSWRSFFYLQDRSIYQCSQILIAYTTAYASSCCLCLVIKACVCSCLCGGKQQWQLPQRGERLY